MKAWYLGNTTVRSALRLRDGLIVIQKYNLEGKIRGVEGDALLRECFGEVGLVSLGADDTNSVGRKWRSALEKLGFLIPKLPDKLSSIQAVIGEYDHISKNGHILIASDSLQAWQECYLRALSAYRITDNGDLSFSPFSFVLKVMIGLHNQTGNSKLNKDEMALFVELSGPQSNAEQIVEDIINFRSHLNSLTGNEKKSFINEKYNQTRLNPQTLKNDYADTNFRYLKATGLFKSSRTSIILDEDKLYIAEEISQHFWRPNNLREYYQGLCEGAPLPTDNINVAKQTASVFANKLRKYGIPVSEEELNSISDVADINAKRYELEEQLFKIREKEFAAYQINCTDEIIAYLELLICNKNSKKLKDDIEIDIPSSDRPAYFEWVIWRAFLAINSIINPPWESRNFKVDPDFKPISHAASGSSDLIFEFNDFILVVEVTLTQSSRQEAAEGEPVRRHVANYAQEYLNRGKSIFGLFLAIKIDTNTANTFRLGEWYLPDDSLIHVNIVPAKLADFKALFEAGSKQPNMILEILKALLIRCRSESSKLAPEWKNLISNHFQSEANLLKSKITIK